MSPAHIHQYAASLSPGQLSESLPSSQVIVYVLCFSLFILFNYLGIFSFLIIFNYIHVVVSVNLYIWT